MQYSRCSTKKESGLEGGPSFSTQRNVPCTDAQVRSRRAPRLKWQRRPQGDPAHGSHPSSLAAGSELGVPTGD